VFSRGEQIRLVGWSLAVGCAAIGWNVFLWKASWTASPELLAAVLGTSTGLGALGGIVVPRSGTSWSALITECGAGACAAGLGCFLIFVIANASQTANEPDSPFVLGIGALLIGVAFFMMITPLFVSGYAVRVIVWRFASVAS